MDKLHITAQGDNTNMLELLPTKGAPTEVMDKVNNTLLHLAVQGGHTSTVEILLSWSYE